MTDAAEVDLQRIRGSLLTSVSSETAYMKDLKENYEMLIGGAKQLKALRNDMEMEIRRHNIRPHIREWLAKVERINIEVNQLETLYNDEMKHPGRLVRFGECSNLSKYMEKKHEEVHSLLKEGLDKRRVLVAEFSELARKIRAPKIEDSSLCNVVEDVVSFLQDKQIRRIGIWGTVGTGKTTIMKNVIDHKDMAKIFDMVIWVTVSKEWSKKTFQDAIMQRLKMNMKGSVSIKENSLRISEELKGKKCLILLDEVYDFIDLDEVIGINQSHESKVVLASRLRDICKGMEADELINVKPLSDHEAFNMFREKLGRSIYSPQIERVAEQVVRECGGLPLLINIVAMIFRNKRQDISLWMDGLKHLQRWEDIDGMDHVIEFLKSCYDYLDSDTKKACYLYCALFPGEYDINVDYLLECWKAEGFIQNADEFVRGTDAFRDARSKGHAILDDLINLSLLERSDKGKCVKTNRMLRKMALKISFQSNGSKFLAKPCEGLQDFPGRKEWEDANRISLMDNELCTLPEFLHCHNLSTLLLQRNNGLIAIPKFFFQSMRSLRVLDLHGTGIESLPSSISDLICLRGLYLNSCTHLIQLPPNIRALDQLELLDIRGTKLNLLQIGSLIWLKCLRISSNFFIGIRTQRKLGNISRFVSLEEFCVDDDLSVEWRYKASEIVMEVATLRYKLTSLKFCFPTMHFLQFFVQTSPAWKKKCFSFQFSVGYQDSAYSYFLESSSDYPSYNSLKLVNGEGWHPVIKHVLKVTNAFGLINHKGVSALSNFGTNNMKNMCVCLVDGCNEIRVIINGYTTGKRVLKNLKILYINNVPKLRSIWQGFVPDGSLAQLTTLTLTKCPELKRIFSSGMIQQLPSLQHLRVEECYQIEEIIMVSENHGLNVDALPRLKTLVLIDLPKLRSIWVDDSLEWPSLQRIKISMCYMLKRLPFNNANAAKLRFIEGQELWWKALVWKDDAVKQRLKFLCILN